MRFTEKELNSLKRNNDKTAHAILLQCYSGLNIEELCEVKRSDVDPDELTIRVRVKGEMEVDRIVQIEREHERILLYLYFESLGRQSKYLFCDKYGNKKQIEVYKKEFKNKMLVLQMRRSFEDTWATYNYISSKNIFVKESKKLKLL